MGIEEVDGLWVIRTDDGEIIGPFDTNAEAWKWLERSERDPLWLKGKRRNRQQVGSHIRHKLH